MRLSPDYGPPIWLLDVDGVLCPYGRPEWEDEPEEVSVAAMRIMYSPALVDRVLRLHESGAAEVRWCTSWGDAAAEELAPALGLPPFVVSGEEYPGWRHGGFDWKAAECARALHEYRPVIWTDDDAWLPREPWDTPGSDEPTSLVERNIRDLAETLEVPLLMVRPDRDVGLTPANMAEIETFLGVEP